MTKKEFFRQPTISEIIGGRKVLKPERGSNLVAIINNLTPSFAVHVEFPIIPMRFNDSRRFLRYGNEARVGRAVEVPPEEAIAKALDEAQTPFGSIVMTSRIDNVTVTRLVLDTCIEGMKLYAYACRNAPVQVEGPYKKPDAIAEFGADFRVLVPSEENKEDRHDVRFSNIPLYSEHKGAALYSQRLLWTDIGASCDCDYTKWWITSRYIRERVYCQHIIAAYYAVAAESFKRGYTAPSWAIPFPIFSADAVRFWKKMLEQVIKTKNGKRYALNASERSLMLGEYIKSHGVEKALCKRKQQA